MASLDNVYDWILSHGTIDFQLETVQDALSGIAQGIQRCVERVENAAAVGSDEYAEIIAEQKGETIESLLGSAFVVCQTHITRVVADIRTLHRLASNGAEGRPAVELATTTAHKREVILFGSPRIDGTNITEVQAMDALANYFKHRDEWVRDWANLTGQSGRTVAVIQPIGLEQGASGNLRTGAETLGNVDYVSMTSFVNKLSDWHKHLIDTYKTELQNAGVLA